MAKKDQVDYNSMSIEELESLNNELDERIQDIREQRRSIQLTLGEKIAEEAARLRIETMSDPEKKALLQQLQVESIESEEAVGEPA